ncbi:hypothetical protein [Rhodococcus ruber]|uniref:hypothetical protein n=1 Tax=Rhodococcus ruber TaxID=1830 RepID=UPI00200EEFC0|nr:hypothetical protein [Rhodococcus ruber]
MASHAPPPPGPMFDPPPSDVDLFSQIEDVEQGAGRWHPIIVEGITLRARKPQPTALRALTAATSKSVGAAMRNDMVTLFVQDHLDPESWERLLVHMLDPATDFDVKSLGEVMKRIATLGTNRPTVPSSVSRWRRRPTGARFGRS